MGNEPDVKEGSKWVSVGHWHEGSWDWTGIFLQEEIACWELGQKLGEALGIWSADCCCRRICSLKRDLESLFHLHLSMAVGKAALPQALLLLKSFQMLLC